MQRFSVPKSHSSETLCSRSGCKFSVCAVVYRNSPLNFRVKHPTTWQCASTQLYLPQKPTRVFYRRDETLLTIQYRRDLYNSGASFFFFYLSLLHSSLFAYFILGPTCLFLVFYFIFISFYRPFNSSYISLFYFSS